MSCLRGELNLGLVECAPRPSQLDADFPMPTHREIPLRAIDAVVLLLQGKGIGAHVHIQHGRQQLDLEMGDGLLALRILHVHCELVQPHVVRGDGELDEQGAIRRGERGMKSRRSGTGGGWRATGSAGGEPHKQKWNHNPDERAEPRRTSDDG